MADAPDLGSGGATRGGSSPLARTIFTRTKASEAGGHVFTSQIVRKKLLPALNADLGSGRTRNAGSVVAGPIKRAIDKQNVQGLK